MIQENNEKDTEKNIKKQAQEQNDAESSNKSASLEEQLKAEQAKAEDYFNKLQRTHADFINYKRRVEQERSGFTQQAEGNLMLTILPVIDDLERALDAVPEDIQDHSWVDGIKHIHRKLVSALEARGLKRIEAIGADFDPNYHESAALTQGEEDKVVDEIKPGYTLYGKVLRPCTVLVGSGDKGGCGKKA